MQREIIPEGTLSTNIHADNLILYLTELNFFLEIIPKKTKETKHRCQFSFFWKNAVLLLGDLPVLLYFFGVSMSF